MGIACCTGGKKQKNTQEPMKKQSTFQNLKGGSKRQIGQEKQHKTTTSYCDIRKVYKFTPKVLGHGNFGTVRLATDTNNGRVVAVKTI